MNRIPTSLDFSSIRFSSFLFVVVGLLLRINGEIQHLRDGCRLGSPQLFIMSMLYSIAGNSRPFHELYPAVVGPTSHGWCIQGWGDGKGRDDNKRRDCCSAVRSIYKNRAFRFPSHVRCRGSHAGSLDSRLFISFRIFSYFFNVDGYDRALYVRRLSRNIRHLNPYSRITHASKCAAT